MFIDLELYVCPQCGSLAVGKLHCLSCGSQMIATGQRIDVIIIENLGKEQTLKHKLLTLSPKIFNPKKYPVFNKQKALFHFRETKSASRVLRKTNVLICPCCGHISRTSYFYDNSQCCICHTAYDDIGKRCSFYYFSRGSSTDDDISSTQNELRNKYCENNRLFNKAAWDKRIGIEKERLPCRLETMSIVSSSGGHSVQLENLRIQLLILNILANVSLYASLLETSPESTKEELMSQFCDLITDAYCTVAFQYFAGQQFLVNLTTSFLIDISMQIQCELNV